MGCNFLSSCVSQTSCLHVYRKLQHIHYHIHPTPPPSFSASFSFSFSLDGGGATYPSIPTPQDDCTFDGGGTFSKSFSPDDGGAAIFLKSGDKFFFEEGSITKKMQEVEECTTEG